MLSATLLVLLHLSMHVVDEGHAVNPSCSCIRFTSTHGKERSTFSSPDYPQPYPRDICLLYTFIAAPHQIVELTFTDFDVFKDGRDCTHGDYVKVYWEVQGPGPPGAINERTAWMRVLCGSKADVPPTLYSPGASMVLEFHTNSKPNNATGFLGTYSFIDRRLFETEGVRIPGTECDYKFSRSGNRRSHGRLYSPLYPSTYPNNMRCSYYFHARPKDRVKVVFEEVSLQKGDISCLRRADIIKVFDGRDTDSPAIAMLCNELTGYEVLSTGPGLLLQFTANSASPGQGFVATYQFQPPPDSTAADSDRLLKLSFGKAFESLGPEVSATMEELLDSSSEATRSAKQNEDPCTENIGASNLGANPTASTEAGPSSEAVHTDETPSIEVDNDLLDILGIDPSATVEYGKDIHSELASRLQHIATSGLTKESRKELNEKYLIPANCAKVGAPSMNPEIKAAVTETVMKRDKGIEARQKQLASAISGLADIINREIETKDKDSTRLKQLMDVCRILCDIQHAESVTRRNFAIFSIKKELKEHLVTTKIDNTLFGDNLAETLKSAKAVTKSGSELKTKPPPKPKSSVSGANLNWKSPAPARKQQQPPRGGRDPPPPPAPGPAARSYRNTTRSNSSKPSPRQSRQTRRH